MILLPSDFWMTKKIKNKGKGIFAQKTISKGTVIGDYLGQVIRPEDAVVNEANFYLMYYHDRAVIVPDLESDGAHLFNNSCDPNAWLYIYRGHTLAFALRNILKGEEITIPYLLPPITKFCNPCLHVCICGSSECTGSMHLSSERYKRWRMITDKQSKKTKRERIRYGKPLNMLSEYPNIEDEYIRQILTI